MPLYMKQRLRSFGALLITFLFPAHQLVAQGNQSTYNNEVRQALW